MGDGSGVGSGVDILPGRGVGPRKRMRYVIKRVRRILLQTDVSRSMKLDLYLLPFTITELFVYLF